MPQFEVHLDFETSVHSAFNEIRESLSARENKLIQDSQQIQMNKGTCPSPSSVVDQI
jgi:hypothetical protein